MQFVADILPWLWVAIPVLVMAIWQTVTYNRLAKLEKLKSDAWSDVQTELKRRYDLIGNLVHVVNAYAAHERDLIRQLATARSRAQESTGSPPSQANEENELIRTIRTALSVVEDYPELQASKHFIHVQRELASTEERVEAARQSYNQNVTELNNLVAILPSRIIAQCCNISAAEFFEIEDSDQSVAVSTGTPGDIVG